MKKGFLWLFVFLILGAILLVPINSWENLLTSKTEKSEKQEFRKEEHIAPKTDSYLVRCLQKDGIFYVNLHELSQKLSLQTKVDDKNGQVFLADDHLKFSFLKDVAVFEKNGLYYPMRSPLFYQGKQIWIPLETVERMFDGQAQMKSNQQAMLLVNRKQSPPPAIPVNLSKMTPEGLVSYLSFLSKPIKGAHVSTKDSSLPGAPRTYRKGVHEGIDWYGGPTTGVPITKNTPVFSMADGIVVRVDHHYKEMTTAERQQLLALGRKNNGQTPQYVLDKLRGRSVWIQHDRGVMARYVHLDRVNPHLKVGQKIKKGEQIGYVGNSGTSDGAKGNNQGVHLHLDIFIYGQWPWGSYTMRERRMILERIFPKEPAANP